MADKGDNMIGNAVEPLEKGDEDKENVVDDADEDETISEEEFKALSEQMDQLNLVLDTLESKNDHIHAGLVELLKSNREARKQFQESQEDQPPKKEEAKS